MRTPPDKCVTLTLYSHPMKDLGLRWKATVTFAPGSTDDTLAEVNLRDGRGEPIVTGLFELAGVRIAVTAGRGVLRCGDFVRGKHEPGIWLHRPGVAPVPGALTFE